MLNNERRVLPVVTIKVKKAEIDTFSHLKYDVIHIYQTPDFRKFV